MQLATESNPRQPVPAGPKPLNQQRQPSPFHCALLIGKAKRRARLKKESERNTNGTLIHTNKDDARGFAAVCSD